jgi:hypothetical protein
MKCNREQAAQCPAYNAEKPCWEVMREIDALSFNICRDCIVYVIKQKDSIFSKEEILSIMHQKGVDVTNVKCAQLRGCTPPAQN